MLNQNESAPNENESVLNENESVLNENTSDPSALIAALTEIERFVGHGGWDQPARLFALVETDDLIASEPKLAAELGLRGSKDGAPAGALTSVEQEDFHLDDDLGRTLAQIAWPTTVRGCALSIERAFLPRGAEQDLELPDDPEAAAAIVMRSPQHDELRIICGAVRTGGEPLAHSVARLRSSDDLIAAPDLVPGLGRALGDTLRSDEAGQ